MNKYTDTGVSGFQSLASVMALVLFVAAGLLWYNTGGVYAFWICLYGSALLLAVNLFTHAFSVQGPFVYKLCAAVLAFEAFAALITSVLDVETNANLDFVLLVLFMPKIYKICRAATHY